MASAEWQPSPLLAVARRPLEYGSGDGDLSGLVTASDHADRPDLHGRAFVLSRSQTHTSDPAVRRRPYRHRPMPKKYREVRRALTDAGWTVVRQQGSHEVWAHHDHDQRIVVAGKDSDTVPVGTLGSIRRAS